MAESESSRPEPRSLAPAASTSIACKSGTGAPVPWRPLLAAYAAEANLAPATVKRWSGVMAELEAALGRDDLASVTRRDLID
jgi:hypothetical protein